MAEKQGRSARQTDKPRRGHILSDPRRVIVHLPQDLPITGTELNIFETFLEKALAQSAGAKQGRPPRER